VSFGIVPIPVGHWS